MQQFLSDPELEWLNLETHCLPLAIAKKTLDENRLKNAQKTMNHTSPSFEVGDRVYFKNKQPEKLNLKWSARYGIVCIKHKGHYLHIENHATGKTSSCNIKDVVHNPPVEPWNIDTQFDRAAKSIIILQICQSSPLALIDYHKKKKKEKRRIYIY